MMILQLFLERMLNLVEYLDVLWGLMKNMGLIEFLIPPYQSKELLDLQLEWQQAEELQ